MTVECGVSGSAPVSPEAGVDLVAARKAGFDQVIGIGPEKGGAFNRDQLRSWFADDAIVLV